MKKYIANVYELMQNDFKENVFATMTATHLHLSILIF